MTGSTSSWLRGIDVSHSQGEVNWSVVAADRIQFCFIKATEGATDVDPRFAQNWEGARAAGGLRGAYHFLRREFEPRQQAEHYLSVFTLDAEALPPVLDIEVADGADAATLQSGIRSWVDTVGAATKCKPILYAAPYFWQEHVDTNFGDYPLWLAYYANKPEMPANWHAWTFWQHADNGSVNGIAGSVDLGFCALSFADFQKLRGA